MLPKTVLFIKYLSLFALGMSVVLMGIYIWAIDPGEQFGFFKGVLDGVYSQAADKGYEQYSSEAAGYLSAGPIMLILASSILLWNINKPSKGLLIASFIFVCFSILVSLSPIMLIILALLFPKSSRKFLVGEVKEPEN